jgi:hypothetical protein
MIKSRTLRMIDITINAYKNRHISLLEALEIIKVYIGINLKRNQIKIKR